MLAAPLVSQAAPPIQILAGAGLATPMAPDGFDEQWDAGVDVAAGVSVRLVPRMSIRVVGSWASMPFDERRFAAGIVDEAVGTGMPPDEARQIDTSVSGGEFRQRSLGGELKLATMAGLPVVPYLFGGVGVTRVSLENATITIRGPDRAPLVRTVREDRETQRMVTLGAGADFGLWEPVSLFGELRYVVILNDADDTGYAVTRGGILIGL